MCGNTTLTMPDGAADEKSAYCHCRACIKQSGARQSHLLYRIERPRAHTLSSGLSCHADARGRCHGLGPYEDIHR
jgi:hypothetical protein